MNMRDGRRQQDTVAHKENVAVLSHGDGRDGRDTIFRVKESFPIEVFPKSVREYVEQASESVGCPVELVALPMLVLLGSAIGASRMIASKDDWTEYPTIFAAAVAGHGEKKSPSAKKVFDLLTEEQSSLYKKYKENTKHYDSLEDHYKESPPKLETLWVGDTTVEALMPILEDNPRGVLVQRDELGAWAKSMDQYKKSGNDRQVWLSLWNSADIRVDRKGTDTIIVNKPYVSIYGTIQPSVLSEISKGIEDGMAERFLYVYPEYRPHLWSDSVISEKAKENLSWLYSRLRKLEMGEDSNGIPKSKVVAFTPSAKSLYIEFYNAHVIEQNSTAVPSNLMGYWSKLESYFLRIILILAVTRAAEQKATEVVTEEDVTNAYTLINYFKSQVRKVKGYLHEPTKEDELEADLIAFLSAMGGRFSDQPTYVHHLVQSGVKGESPSRFTRLLRELGSPKLLVNPDKRNKKRVLDISLQDTVSTVSTVSEPYISGIERDATVTLLSPSVSTVSAEEVREGYEKLLAGEEAYGEVLAHRYGRGEISKDDWVEMVTRLVLYALELPTDDWYLHKGTVEQWLDQRFNYINGEVPDFKVG